MPESQLWLVNHCGAAFSLGTSQRKFQQLANTWDDTVAVKRLSASHWCAWAVGHDHRVFIYVLASDVPIRVADTIYENQRWTPVSGFSRKGLIPTDRPAWTDETGTVYRPKESVRLPSAHWEWDDDWFIDDNLRGDVVGVGGWQYAFDFPGVYSPEKHWNSFVRKRKWIRFRRYSSTDLWARISDMEVVENTECFMDISVGGFLLPSQPAGFLSVWAVTNNGNVYVRTNVNHDNPEGSTWHQLGMDDYKGVINISVGASNLVWAITWDGHALVRTNVSMNCVYGKSWVMVEYPDKTTRLMQVAVGKNAVWALSRDGEIWFRKGTSGDDMFWNQKLAVGTSWVKMVGEMSQIAVSSNDQVFAVDLTSKIVYFRTAVTRSDLTGKTWQPITLREDFSALEREGLLSEGEICSCGDPTVPCRIHEEGRNRLDSSCSSISTSTNMDDNSDCIASTPRLYSPQYFNNFPPAWDTSSFTPGVKENDNDPFFTNDTLDDESVPFSSIEPAASCPALLKVENDSSSPEKIMETSTDTLKQSLSQNSLPASVLSHSSTEGSNTAKDSSTPMVSVSRPNENLEDNSSDFENQLAMPLSKSMPVQLDEASAGIDSVDASSMELLPASKMKSTGDLNKTCVAPKDVNVMPEKEHSESSFGKDEKEDGTLAQESSLFPAPEMLTENVALVKAVSENSHDKFTELTEVDRHLQERGEFLQSEETDKDAPISIAKQASLIEEVNDDAPVSEKKHIVAHDSSTSISNPATVSETHTCNSSSTISQLVSSLHGMHPDNGFTIGSKEEKDSSDKPVISEDTAENKPDKSQEFSKEIDSHVLNDSVSKNTSKSSPEICEEVQCERTRKNSHSKKKERKPIIMEAGVDNSQEDSIVFKTPKGKKKKKGRKKKLSDSDDPNVDTQSIGSVQSVEETLPPAICTFSSSDNLQHSNTFGDSLPHSKNCESFTDQPGLSEEQSLFHSNPSDFKELSGNYVNPDVSPVSDTDKIEDSEICKTSHSLAQTASSDDIDGQTNMCVIDGNQTTEKLPETTDECVQPSLTIDCDTNDNAADQNSILTQDLILNTQICSQTHQSKQESAVETEASINDTELRNLELLEQPNIPTSCNPGADLTSSSCPALIQEGSMEHTHVLINRFNSLDSTNSNPDKIIDFVNDVSEEEEDSEKKTPSETDNPQQNTYVRGNGDEVIPEKSESVKFGLTRDSSHISINSTASSVSKQSESPSNNLSEPQEGTVLTPHLEGLVSQVAKDEPNIHPKSLSLSSLPHARKISKYRKSPTPSYEPTSSNVPLSSMMVAQPRLCWRWIDATSCVIEDVSVVEWLTNTADDPDRRKKPKKISRQLREAVMRQILERNIREVDHFKDIEQAIKRTTWVKKANMQVYVYSGRSHWIACSVELEQGIGNLREGCLTVHYQHKRHTKTIQISLEEITCVKFCSDMELPSGFTIYTSMTNLIHQPLMLKANSETEAADWIGFLCAANANAWNINQPISPGAAWSCTFTGDVFVSPDTSADKKPFDMCWGQHGGHMGLVETGPSGITWGLGFDKMPYVYNGGYGGAVTSELSDMSDSTQHITDSHRVFVYENQKWFPVVGWCCKGVFTNNFHWLTESGRSVASKDDVKLPSSKWQWTSVWAIDFTTPGGVDKNGWQFSNDLCGSFQPRQYLRASYRRRRWVRRCKISIWGPWQTAGPLELVDLSIQVDPLISTYDPIVMWAVGANGDVLCRHGVEVSNPLGKSWIHVATDLDKPFKSISVGGDYRVWGIASDGSAWFRPGVTPATPAGKCWLQVVPPPPGTFPLHQVSAGMTAVWAVDLGDNLWRRENITPTFPEGTNWELVASRVKRVSVGPNDQVWIVSDSFFSKLKHGAGVIYNRVGITDDKPSGTDWEVVIGSGWAHVSVRGVTQVKQEKPTSTEKEESWA